MCKLKCVVYKYKEKKTKWKTRWNVQIDGQLDVNTTNLVITRICDTGRNNVTKLPARKKSLALHAEPNMREKILFVFGSFVRQ